MQPDALNAIAATPASSQRCPVIVHASHRCRTVLSVQIGRIRGTPTTVTDYQAGRGPKMRQPFRSWKRGKLGESNNCHGFPSLHGFTFAVAEDQGVAGQLARSRSGSLPEITPSTAAWISSVNAREGIAAAGQERVGTTCHPP